jgi:hypothetical protein
VHGLTIDRIYANDNVAALMVNACFEHPVCLECGEGVVVCLEITTDESNEGKMKLKLRINGEIQNLD